MASRELKVEIVGDSRSLERALGKASSSSSRFGSTFAKAGKAAALGLVAVGVGAAVAGKKMIDMASDAAEVDSKLDVVFGKALPELTKNIEDFSEKTGASKFALREQAADMGALLEPLTKTKKGAADMSVQFVKLATDLGSFNNVPVADALLAIRSGLVGEAEPLRRFGVLLNATAVGAQAMKMGLAETTKELTEQDKVQARAALITQQTTLAQGDATRTAGSMANQMKALRNNISDAATEMGAKLIPFALAAVKAFNDNWPQIEKVVDRVMDLLVRGIGAAVTAVRTHFQTIKTVVTSAFSGLLAAAQKAGAFLKTDFGQQLAAAAVSTLVFSKAFIAVRAGITATQLALSGLAKNPFFIAMVPIGIAVGVLAQKFIKAKVDAANFAAGLQQAAGSADALKASLDRLNSSETALESSKLALIRANQQATVTEVAWHKAVRESGAGSKEARAAYLTHRESLNAVKAATDGVTAATKENKDATVDRNTVLTQGTAKLKELTKGHQEVERGTIVSEYAAKEFANSLRANFIPQAQKAAENAKKLGDEAGARAQTKLLSLAKAAVSLAGDMKAVPKMTEIIAEARLKGLPGFKSELGKIPKHVSTAISSAKSVADSESPSIGSAMSSGISAGFDFSGLIAQTQALVRAAIKAGRNAGSTTEDASKPIGKDITEGAGKGVKEGEEKLKEITAASVRKAVGAAQLAAATMQIGSKAVRDIITGIVGEMPSLKKQFADAVKTTADATLSNAEIQALNRRFGKDIIDKVRAGMKDATPTAVQEAAAAAREIVKSLKEAATAALATARENFKSAFGNLISSALSAFDAMVSAWKPPSLQLLDQIEFNQQVQSLSSAITKAGTDLQKAREELAKGGTPEDVQKNQQAVMDAEQALADARLAQVKFNLQQQAAAEQQAHDDQMAKDRERLETRLGAIQSKYLKEKDLSQAEIRKMNKEIRAAMDEAGVDSQGAGQNISNMLALGIQSAIGEVTKAVRALANVMRKNWKTRSNAQEGPLSDIMTWWTGLGTDLAGQIDPTPVAAAAGAVGMALKSGIKDPSQSIIDTWGSFGRSKDELIDNLGLLQTTATATAVPVTEGIVDPVNAAAQAAGAGVAFVQEFIGQLKQLQGTTASAYVNIYQTTFAKTVPVGGGGENPVTGGDVPWFARGGIVYKPTLGVIGEKGPEAVVPLSKMSSMGGGTNVYVTVQGQVTSERDLVASIRNALVQEGRRSGGNLLGGYA